MPIARPVRVTQDARSDVNSAQDWYEEQSPGLGTRFRGQLDITIQRIADNPVQFPVAIRDVRHVLVRRFPYSLFFRVEPDAVTVIACFHVRRDPEEWHRRIQH